MKTADGKDAPGFWINADDLDENNPTKVKSINKKSNEKIKAIENFANGLITSAYSDLLCT